MQDQSRTICRETLQAVLQTKEGALPRETVRRPGAHVRWIDGLRNIANVLTKHNAEKETLREFLRTGMLTLQQSEQNKQVKEKQREARQATAKAQREDRSLHNQLRKERKKLSAETRAKIHPMPHQKKIRECEDSPWSSRLDPGWCKHRSRLERPTVSPVRLK